LDKPHILALAAEIGFLLFKEQVPLKDKKISAVQCESKTFRFISLSTPVSYINREAFPLNRLYFICKIKGNLLFKLPKTGFCSLSQNMWLIHFNGAPAANN
jgi:hypothetical protein